MPFLRIDDIEEGFLNLDESVCLPESIISVNKTIKRCDPGDIVVAKGGATIGKTAILTSEYAQYSACRDLIIIRNGQLKGINAYYLLTYLLSSVGQSMMIRTASQTGQPHLTLTAIKELIIPTFTNLQELIGKSVINAYRLITLANTQYAQAEQLFLSDLGLNDWKSPHALTFTSSFANATHANRIDAEYFQPKYRRYDSTSQF